MAKVVSWQSYMVDGMLMLKPPPTNLGLLGGVTEAMMAISCASPPWLGSMSTLGKMESFLAVSLSLACFLVRSRNFRLTTWHSSAIALSFSSRRMTSDWYMFFSAMSPLMTSDFFFSSTFKVLEIFRETNLLKKTFLKRSMMPKMIGGTRHQSL